MKKLMILILCCATLSITGCSVKDALLSATSVPETMKGWSFQYNEGTDDYSLFFGFLDKNEKEMACSVDVDIRIVDEKENVLYSGTKSVTKSDFSYYTSEARGEQYLANVRIATSEISQGVSRSGKVYFTVYKDDIVQFDEANCSALYCLPVKDVVVTAENLPVELDIKNYMGAVEAKLRIDTVEYEFDKDLFALKLIFSGEQTYGKSSSGYDIFTCKVYDSAGYLIESRNIYISGLATGDKFKDDSFSLYDTIPGETYTVKLFSYE